MLQIYREKFLLPLIFLGVLAFAGCCHPCHAALALRGKRALVTGSSGGIGAGIAKQLALEGADVLVHYHTRREGALATARAIQNADGRCAGVVHCDFRSPQAITSLFELMENSIWKDGFDILVNNAGLITKLASDDDDEHLSAWHETLQVNLHAPLQLSRLAKRQMIKRTQHSENSDSSVIINVSSIHGERSVEYMTAYAASKAALDALTRGLAWEYKEDRIRVNGIAPGIVPVERTQEALSNPTTRNLWLPHLASGELGSVEQVAQATLGLVANEWITGTTWTIDGGMMARSNMPVRPQPDKMNLASSPPISSEVTFDQVG